MEEIRKALPDDQVFVPAPAFDLGLAFLEAFLEAFAAVLVAAAVRGPPARPWWWRSAEAAGWWSGGRRGWSGGFAWRRRAAGGRAAGVVVSFGTLAGLRVLVLLIGLAGASGETLQAVLGAFEAEVLLLEDDVEEFGEGGFEFLAGGGLRLLILLGGGLGMLDLVLDLEAELDDPEAEFAEFGVLLHLAHDGPIESQEGGNLLLELAKVALAEMFQFGGQGGFVLSEEGHEVFDGAGAAVAAFPAWALVGLLVRLVARRTRPDAPLVAARLGQSEFRPGEDEQPRRQ